MTFLIASFHRSYFYNISIGLFLFFATLTASYAAGSCVRVTSTSALSAAAINAGYTAASWTGAADGNTVTSLGLPGVINLSSESSFQPSGTLLASSTASFLSSGHKEAYSPNQILFRCDATAVAAGLYEFYSTNGDENYSGKNITSEVDGAYYTYVKNVAIRLTNIKTGEHFSRYWKSRQLTPQDWYSDGTYTYIPASAFSDVFVELYKVDGTYGTQESSNRYTYAYWSVGSAQPAGYTAFKGGSLSAGLSNGADHASNYSGFYAYWPAGYGLTSFVTFVRGASCIVKDYPSYVTIPAISISELNSGNTSQVAFDVSLKCESGAISSTSTSTNTSANVAMGFLVNNHNAVSKAQSLGLTTGSGGLTWLLDSNYGLKTGEASGVGIKILNRSHQPINLLPAKSSYGSGNGFGWYGFKDLLIFNGNENGSNIYTGDFTAVLSAIPGQDVTAGSVNAQLQVIVSFQ
ncbi:TPA: fimbrial usher protein StbD [Klebsiella quasipneumoniae subsp. similipneumoniae]|uniref:fimbrial usher protein StbD n=1 Tax=Klebsiella quasipneumoniae TaxID=1463165 RepID=UPI000DE7AAD4|nr:fimbrial usher protein StbD [Klebsiella quasipneumoniae]SSM85434.1 putative fimbriae; usher [Klebsiella quasipneumoniae]HBQ6237241.1 fimbrial usher protein StbD [Klebsiella quasipneumoniae subsp. similipneumoniae]HBV1839434.1 fimbrial usher protein StbD [Klebsiella quasipneumoniae]